MKRFNDLVFYHWLNIILGVKGVNHQVRKKKKIKDEYDFVDQLVITTINV